jgi:hypothetical protein
LNSEQNFITAPPLASSPADGVVLRAKDAQRTTLYLVYKLFGLRDTGIGAGEQRLFVLEIQIIATSTDVRKAGRGGAGCGN